MSIWSIAGDAFLGAYFLFLAVDNGKNWLEIVTNLREKKVKFAALGLWVGIALRVFTGLMLLVSYQATFAAIVLGVTVAVNMVVNHRFWELEKPACCQGMGSFMNQLAILGGLLLVIHA